MARRSLLSTLMMWIMVYIEVLAAPVRQPASPTPTMAPPGFNVHAVLQTPDRHVFWRGGAPRKDTLQSLAEAARARGVEITLIDLRVPPSQDDLSGKGGRLSPAQEAEMAKRSGARYVAVSALDASLHDKILEGLSRGDVYLHCMYGVNRTGFAMGRFARHEKVRIPRDGLGRRDWEQGDAFEARKKK